MINICLDCTAVREYPSGKLISICPRCDSNNIKYINPKDTGLTDNEKLIAAIDGSLAEKLI